MSDRRTRSSTSRIASFSGLLQTPEIIPNLSKRSRQDRAVVEVESSPANSPISTLPTETLCQIFLLAQLTSHTGDKLPEKPLVEVVVSHVCKRWRDMAIAFPILWTCFRYVQLQLQDVIPHARLAAYLERSSPLLLDLFFDVTCVALSFAHSYHMKEENLCLLSSTIPHANRWRRVSFISKRGFSTEELYKQLISLEAPHLESFVLNLDDDDDYSVFEPDIDQNVEGDYYLGARIFAGGAPKLTKVIIESPKHLPPLSTVTVLHLEGLKGNDAKVTWIWREFTQILKSAPLTSLSICDMQVLELPGEDDRRIIKADKLKHLRIGGDEECAIHFLFHLTAPVLETLILLNLEGMSEEIQSYLPSQPAPVFPLLRILGLSYVFADTNDEVDFIINMAPNVKHLIISHDPDDGGGVAYRLWESACWPHLRELTSNVPCKNIPIKPFIDFSLARKQFGLELHAFRMWSELFNSWGTSELKQLQSYCEVIEPFSNQFDHEAWPPE